VIQFSSDPKSYLAHLNEVAFDSFALNLFAFQFTGNPLYRTYCEALHRDPGNVHEVKDIPFLPISFFKTHRVQTGDWTEAELVFESSGTTGTDTSRHFVRDAALYETALLRGFEERFGNIEEWTILALLPSYLERKNASLVHMAQVLMNHSGQTGTGFYLNELDALAKQLQTLEHEGKKVLLLGVTFALLDFAESFPMDLSGITVMETGGMKGRREEWTREQVHDFLRQQWKLASVATEYGMTELLSQAYSTESGMLQPASTMRVFVRELSDPLSVAEQGSGILNVVDLANLHSCAFIATEDLGRIGADGHFEVLGRVDHSILRGCSLMAV
jgi:phenylacetate-coenzyme A ligase PaaK-like adenylate-forming protein